ncbi:MAG: diacylglycerol/lipid kinase family protein [Anaerovoracaceae bacterium]
MKHIFILNPAAGKGKAEQKYLPKIIDASKKLGIDYEIHRTMGRGDAENFIRRRCKALGEATRFYICGGDGTLNEAVNGAYGFEHVELAMIPAGTGNDFVRNFDCPESFLDIEAQINGNARPVDLIRYRQLPRGIREYIETGEQSFSNKMDELFYDDGNHVDIGRYGINMFNIGLDADVVVKASELKKHPLVFGAAAYGVGIAMVLGRKKCVDLDIEFDDGTQYIGKVMLIAIANGCYCGGGYKGVPYASLDDGYMDVSIVEDVTRRTFVRLLGRYKKGTHLEIPESKNFITYKKCKSITVTPPKTMQISIDGEIVQHGALRFDIVPNAIKFSLPQPQTER